MGKAIRSCMLVLLLACSASAGIMGHDVYQPPPPPPPPSESVQSEGTNDSPQSQPAQETSAEASLLVQIALNLLTLL